MFDLIAFDADDTLWHTEHLYSAALDRFREVLSPYCAVETIDQQAHEMEVHNLRYWGYGIKSFTLSLIEAAIELTGGKIAGGELQPVLDVAKQMMGAEIRLFEGARETVAALAGSYPLMLITKGDLFEQEAKIKRSGLLSYFRHVEIVSDKTAECYAALLRRHHVEPSRFLMVGNSLRSDILPVVALGGRAVHVPHSITWDHENMPVSEEQRQNYVELERLDQLPQLLETLKGKQSA